MVDETVCISVEGRAPAPAIHCSRKPQGWEALLLAVLSAAPFIHRQDLSVGCASVSQTHLNSGRKSRAHKRSRNAPNSICTVNDDRASCCPVRGRPQENISVGLTHHSDVTIHICSTSASRIRFANDVVQLWSREQPEVCNDRSHCLSS